MKFSELTDGLNLNIGKDFEVAGIETDSRNVKQNYIFFALKGEKYDGADFIEQAIKNGAKVIFSESAVKLSNININDVSIFQNNNIYHILNHISKIFFAPIPQNIVAVTGTNGKTSVANFTAQLLTKLGSDATSIGTLGTLMFGDFDKKLSYSGLTSPDIINLMKDLNQIKKKNIDFVAMEASSHGLHQHRLGGIKFKAAAFTNFTQDHLDYHGTMENYFDAKMILFKEYVEKQGYAIINSDIPQFQKINNICLERKLKIISYGRSAKEIKIKDIIPNDDGLEIGIDIFGKNRKIKTPLIGSFQAYNVLCSIGLAMSVCDDIDKICGAAEKLKPVKGRMDIIPAKKLEAKIVIDYAHTPDALEKAIDSLRVHTSGRLITLFGCGGDRDKTKRPQMGKIAVKKSDMVIITDDNPRTENAENIRKEIIGKAKNITEIAGRKDAIKKAINLLKNGDSLLIAGKGHEDYQIVGKEKLPFNEFEIVNEILENV